MARRYDSRTTIFSPEGRLYQVEYAMEAIGNAGSAVGILAKDGVVLAAEKRITSKVVSRPQIAVFTADCQSMHNPFDTKVLPAASGHKCSWCAARENVQA
jgi:hypothetical protein